MSLPATRESWPMWLGQTRGGDLTWGQPLQNPGIRPENRLWQSADAIPPARASDGRRAQTNQDQPGSGGHASPIFARGRIYQYHYRPSGSVFDSVVLSRRLNLSQEEAAAQATRFPRQGNLIFGHDRWLVEATDLLTAIDGRTGETVWQVELGHNGLNYNLFNKSGGGPTPAYHDGRIFVLGTGGEVWAVDAETGEILWQSDIGERTRQNQAYRERAVATGRGPRFREDLLSGFAAADGVAIVSDHRFHRVEQGDGTQHFYDVLGGYVAFDAATGKILWQQADLGAQANPVIWENNGEAFLLTDHLFRVSLRHLRTGEALWEADFGHRHRFGPAVSEDYAIICRSVSREDGTQVSGYRIGREGLEWLWSWPRDQRLLGNALIIGPYGYAIIDGKVRCFSMETGEILASVALGSIRSADGNPLLLAYGGWIITVGEDGARGWVFLDPHPERMAQSKRFFRHDFERGYDISILPALAHGHFFVRTETHLEAYRLD